MISLLPIGDRLTGGLLAGLPLAWLLAHAAHAQQLLNTGQTLYVGPGATLSVGGDYAQTGAAQLITPGTTRVSGAVQAASGTTLDLSTGELTLTRDLSAASATTTATTGTLRLTGTINQTVSLGGGMVGQLVINKPTTGGNRVELPTSLTARTGVTLTAGLVRTASTATLVLPAGTSVTGEGPGQYVQGNLSVTRAAVGGSSDVDFSNGVVINPQGNTLGDVTVTRTAGLQQAGTSYAPNPGGSPTNSIDRIWTITPQTQPAAGTPATLTMSWLADDDGGSSTAASRASAQAFRREAPAPTFAPVGSTQDASGRSLRVAVTSFSDWTVSATTAPLPVVLVAFTAQAEGGAAWLRWTTASELNSAYFEVEASADGQQFQLVGRVAAGGTRTQAQQYSLYDPSLARYAAPVVYYRLRQVDLDGTSTYSPVRTVAVAAGPWAAGLWPNPAGAGQPVTLQLLRPEAAPVQVQLLDAVGRQLSQHTAPAAATLPLPELDGLPPGLYLLQVAQAGQHATLRVVRQ
jgi:hypothetical protein